jgi:glycosyltransferase involved in cell wall biosynthesis
MKSFPLPPTADEVAAATPAIAPVPDTHSRPFWSVMIPTYNCANYLRETLASVLAQDPGPERMQIEVIDDCSTKDDPASVVRELAGDRVIFTRNPKNMGISPTFNECLKRSRGRWVHILHGDDRVKPSFYRRYEALIERYPRTTLLFGRIEKINEQSDVVGESTVAGPLEGGLFPDFITRQATENLCFFPSVVGKREAYESAGGFTTRFSHVADMDMWLRLAFEGDVVYVPTHVADYRVHAASDTNQLLRTGGNTMEIYKLISVNVERFAQRRLPPINPGWREYVAFVAEASSETLKQRGVWKGAVAQMRVANHLSPTLGRRFRLAAYSTRALFSRA